MPVQQLPLLAMGVATRSRSRYDGDTAVPVKRTQMKMVHAQPQWTVQNKQVTRVLFARPAQETEVFITLPVDHATSERLRDSKQLDVVAWDPAAKCAYNRGTFSVSRLHRNQVVLQKLWSAPTQKQDVAATPPPPCSSVNEMQKVDMTVRPIFVHNPAGKKRTTRAATLDKKVRSPPSPKKSIQVVHDDAVATPSPPCSNADFFVTEQTVTSTTNTMWNTRVFARPLGAATKPVTVTPSLATGTPWMRAIPTHFQGVQYKSRLEAKFARLLQLLNVRFVYEPMRHVKSGGGTYTIDFFLPTQQLYVELKPKRPHLEEEQRCEEMSSQGFRVALMYGSSLYKPPFRSELWKGRSHRDYAHHDALRGMCWIDGVKLAGDTVFVVGNEGARTGLEMPGDAKPHLNQVVSTKDMRWNHPLILTAFNQLRDEGNTVFT